MTAIARITGEVATLDLDSNSDILTAIADWRDDLRSRIARTMLIFEMLDVDIDFEQLADECRAFRRCCACLTWRGDIS